MANYKSLKLGDFIRKKFRDQSTNLRHWFESLQKI